MPVLWILSKYRLDVFLKSSQKIHPEFLCCVSVNLDLFKVIFYFIPWEITIKLTFGILFLTPQKFNIDNKNGHFPLKGATFYKPSFWCTFSKHQTSKSKVSVKKGRFGRRVQGVFFGKRSHHQCLIGVFFKHVRWIGGELREKWLQQKSCACFVYCTYSMI